MKHARIFHLRKTIFSLFIFSINSFYSIGQTCSGTWSLQRPASTQCIVGQWIGWQNTNDPPGCPANPTYVGTQSNTFTFDQPVGGFSIDFLGFDGTVLCDRMALAIDGIFYPLNISNLADLPVGTTCFSGSFSYIMLTSDGYITESVSGGPTLVGKGRITINNVNATSVTLSTNDVNGTVFSNPFNCVEVVPINLISFDGAVSSTCKVTLHWQTGIESNVENIEVQRSDNGINFKTVAQVPSRGSNSNYSLQTNHQADGYFRLKINDTDGNFKFSKIIQLSSNCLKPLYQVNPNPSNDIIEITGLQGNESISIYDFAGRKVFNFKKVLSNRFNIAKLPRGIYFVQIINTNVCKTQLKIVKN